jgi:hypothetical protein
MADRTDVSRSGSEKEEHYAAVRTCLEAGTPLVPLKFKEMVCGVWCLGPVPSFPYETSG